jgi:outer membrane protein assembly factor BamD
MNWFLFLFLMIGAGCSSTPPKGATKAEILFKEAERLIEKKRYILAIEKLNEIKTQHPYSFYATPSELRLADIYFLQENYIESAGAYLLFKDLHPKHEKSAYVTYRVAESYYFQLPSTYDRDLTSAYEALKYYAELKNVYPNSEYVKESKKRESLIHQMLENKDLYIADFYFKTKQYKAAQYRYLEILKNYNDEKTLKHSQLRIILSADK